MKLRSWVKIVLLVLVISLSFFVIFSNDGKKKEKTDIVEKKEVNVVDEIYQKLRNYNISLEFINWVNDNYADSLNKLKSLLENNEYDESMWHTSTNNSFIVLNDLYNKKYDSMDNIKIIESNGESTLSFVGDISLADNWYIMPKYDERNKGVSGILSDSVLKEMRESTLMVANSEFTVSNRGTKMAGKQYTFRAKPERLSIYDEMGVDLLTLANNHVYDFGREAFLDMLLSFDEYKLPRIGAGKNIEEAMKPYYFIINGYKFAFVNATRAEKYIMTPEATETNPGVFRCYDPTNMVNLIKEVEKESDYVITIIHFGKEGYHELEEEQVKSAKMYIDAGSDAVIGHHAHVLQGIEFYNNKPIIYNLGDFIFNANTEETAMFQIKLKNNGEMEYYILPALQKNCYTDFSTGTEKQKLIDKIISWSINANIDETGKITEK